jgi:hypothetical protein
MITAKKLDNSQITDLNGEIVGVRTFVRAAAFANLIVGTMVFVEFGILPILDHQLNTFWLGLMLALLSTVVVWCAGALICVIVLAPSRLLRLWRTIRVPNRFTQSGSSTVWDDWLDGPKRLA